MLPQMSSAADVIETEEIACDPWLLEQLHSRLKEVGLSICTYLSSYKAMIIRGKSQSTTEYF